LSLSRRHVAEPMPHVEINIVPLVDVALVLLIIFMVTATFVKTTGLAVTLPGAAAAQQVAPAKREVVIGIARNGQFSWSGVPVSDARLALLLHDEAVRDGAQARVTVQGDTHAEHGRVVAAMSCAQDAGFTHLMIATRPESGETHDRP